jgi:hypothetical protein
MVLDEDGGPLMLTIVLVVMVEIGDLESTLEEFESIEVNEARWVNPGPS